MFDKSRLIVIADVHGRHDLLTNLLAKLKKQYPNYFIIFAGDVADRGPDTYHCYETIKKMVEAGEALFLEGNHDAWVREFVERYQGNHDLNLYWLEYGGDATMRSYWKNYPIVSQYFEPQANFQGFVEAFVNSGHYQFVKDSPLYYEDKYVWVSHAPIPQDDLLTPAMRANWKNSAEILQWSYHGEYGKTEQTFGRDHGKLAVCGHVHALRHRVFSARVYEHCIYLDSGAGCHPSAPLSAAVINKGVLIEIIESDIIDNRMRKDY